MPLVSFLVLEREIDQRQIHRIQIRTQDEGNQSEIPVKMYLILDSQASQYLRLVDQL